MKCHACQGNLPVLARADARYCSTRCRVASHRRQPPAELRGLDRWVRFDSTKRPLEVGGRPASSTNPATWATFHDAARSPVGVGSGFVLNGDGIVCVDLDGCIQAGRLAWWAAELLEGCPATFTELSVSGAGIHVWGKGRVNRGRRIKAPDGGGIEVYGTARYIAVTGRRWSAAPARLADLSQWLPGVVA